MFLTRLPQTRQLTGMKLGTKCGLNGWMCSVPLTISYMTTPCPPNTRQSR